MKPSALWLAAAIIAAPAQAQQPQWDAPRKMLIITSALDSGDAYAAVREAFRREALLINEEDTARGRIASIPRPADSMRGSDASLVYVSLVHRAHGGGSEIWLGGLIRTRVGANIETSTFARVRSGAAMQTNPMGDLIFITPQGGSIEWRRMERIARELSSDR